MSAKGRGLRYFSGPAASNVLVVRLNPDLPTDRDPGSSHPWERSLSANRSGAGRATQLRAGRC
ncbi:MAG: hypothetical protein PVF91_05480 [Chromatiales bacterium]